MLFSLVFATRKRTDLLDGLFHSLANTTARPDQVEVYAVYDDDDNITHAAAPRLTAQYPSLDLKLTRRRRSKRLNEDYINFAARQSTGKFVFVLNDDTIFETPSWDLIAEQILEEYLADKPDRVVYGMIDDSMDHVRNKQGLTYCGFPILSREAVNAVGYAMPPGFNSWGADIYLHEVYHAVGRVCDVRRVRVLHVTHHTPNYQKDETAKHVQTISNDGQSGNSMPDDIRRLASLLGVTILNPSSSVTTRRTGVLSAQPHLPAQAPAPVPAPPPVPKPPMAPHPGTETKAFRRRMDALRPGR